MSSSSNMTLPETAGALLHLVQHLRKGLFQPQRLLDLTGSDKRILAVLEKTGALVFAKELRHRRHVRPPILRPPFQVREYRGDAGLVEECDCVLDVLVEICIEDALIHEVQPG